jgi:hypothetical protein
VKGLKFLPVFFENAPCMEMNFFAEPVDLALNSASPFFPMAQCDNSRQVECSKAKTGLTASTGGSVCIH